MPTPTETPTGSQPLAEQFAHAWRVDALRPLLTSYLPPPGPQRVSALVQLVPIDLEFRLRAGEKARVEDYIARDPSLRDEGTVVVELLVAEYMLRRAYECDVGVVEYADRFPKLAAALGTRLAARAEPLTAVTTATPTAGDEPSAKPPTESQPRVASIPLTIRGELGRGGMGIVYRATDRRGQEVAVKQLPRLDAGTLARFKQEFRALAGVAHRNLVTLYELFSDGANWYYTMELIDGVPFDGYVRNNPSRLRDALRQLAAGVAALHAAGKLHRDLKPSNVLVTRAGRVVVLDFGLAADLNSDGHYLSTEHHVVGTVAYMAPEQAAAQAVTPASDWYSVGVMLYDALTGRKPFAGPPLQVMADRQRFEPRPPADIAPGIDAELSDLCAALLRVRPVDRPTGGEILDRLGPARPPVSVAPPRESALVGREAHAATLATALADVSAGRPRVVLIHGGSGAGKSALANWFLDGLDSRGVAVTLAGRCYERESVPYKAFDSLVDALARYLKRLPRADAAALLPRDAAVLARVFPVLGGVPAVADSPRRSADAPDLQEVRRRAFAALRELLARLGDRQPLVLFIDDLQWGDVDSAERFADLLRPPDPPAMLMVGAYRSEEVAISPCLVALLPALAETAELLAVEPLSEAVAHGLALRLFDPTDPRSPAQAAAVARESCGIPFFVHELARHMRDRGGLPDADVRLQEVIAARVDALPEMARRLLEVVAVAGRPLARMAALAAVGGDAGDQPLAELRASRLVRSIGHGGRELIETYHDRIRESVTARLSKQHLTVCHRELAAALESTVGCDPAILAQHYRAAGNADRAAELYDLAADQAAQALAFELAASHYGLALELRPSPQTERLIRPKLAEALANAGRGQDAARNYLKAAEIADPNDAVDLRLQAALQLVLSGHLTEGRDVLRDVLAAVGLPLPASPRRAYWLLIVRQIWFRIRRFGFAPRAEKDIPRVELDRLDVCWSVALTFTNVDPIIGAYYQSRGLLLALRAGEPSRVAQALAVEGAYLTWGGPKGRVRSEAAFAAASEAVIRVGQPYPSGMLAMSRGVAAYLNEGWNECLLHCDRAEAIFQECAGTTWELDTTRKYALWCLLWMGELGDLTKRWSELTREAKARGNLYAATNLSAWIAAYVRLADDDPAAARQATEQAGASWSQCQFHLQHHNILLADIAVALYQGDAIRAKELVECRFREYRWSHLFRVQRVRIEIAQLHAQAALACGTSEPLLSIAAANARRLRREATPCAVAFAELIDGGIAYARARPERAISSLRSAAAKFESAKLSLIAAAVRRRLGRLVGGDIGRSSVAAADAWMAGQGIVNAARMTAMLAPGFPD